VDVVLDRSLLTE